jgi:glucosamine kinase
MRYLLGIDGGGTRTTLALADETGREMARRTGPAGIVDPRHPGAAAEMLTALARDAVADAGLSGPASALCAGLAGVGSREEREMVRSALRREGLADRIVVCPDGETALYGAFDGGPGILLIAGTGSTGFGRSEDGRVERCGGWGMMVGDEGSGFELGRAALVASLRGLDGRSPATPLLPAILEELGLASADEIPAWAGRAHKSEIAALAVQVMRLADAGEATARELVRRSAFGLVEHVRALIARLGPWTAPTPVVLHGGLTRGESFLREVEIALDDLGLPVDRREAAADAVSGAVSLAREAIAA